MRAHPLRSLLNSSLLFSSIIILQIFTNPTVTIFSRVASIYCYSSRRTATHSIDRAYVKNWYFALNALGLNVSQVPGDIRQSKLSIVSDA